MYPRTIAAYVVLAFSALAQMGIGGFPEGQHGPQSRIVTALKPVTCGADTCCHVVADTDADGNFADDWQGGYNAMRVLGATCASGFTFLPPVTKGPFNLSTKLRICGSAAPASAQTLPTCNASAHYPVKFRGRWNTDSKRFLCKATTGGTVPEGCIWIGNSYADGNLTNQITVDIPVASAPFIEQYTNRVDAFTPFSSMRPLLCDGCTGTVSVRVIPSSRTDIDGVSANQGRFYEPPWFVGNTLTVNLYADVPNPQVSPVAIWTDYAQFLGAPFTVNGYMKDLAIGVGWAGEAVSDYFQSATDVACAWSAARAQALTCSGTFGPNLTLVVNNLYEQALVNLQKFTTVTLSGVFDHSGDSTSGKTTIEAGTGKVNGGGYGNLTLSGTFKNSPNSLNAVTKHTTIVAPTGVLTISGLFEFENTYLKSKADRGAVLCTPQTQAAGRVIPTVIASTARYTGPYNFMMAQGYDQYSMPCDVTSATGLASGSVSVGVQGAQSGTCINFTTGTAEACTNAATKNYVTVSTIISQTKVTLTSSVTGGGLCLLRLRADNGGNGVCGPIPNGCGEIAADPNADDPFNYGSVGLVTNGNSITLYPFDWVPAGHYWQMKVTDDGSCALTGSFTLSWKTYPATESH